MAERHKYYVLDGREIAVVDSSREWGEFFNQTDKRRVGADDVRDLHVSTVFLGIDHSWVEDGPPILFETMVLRGSEDVYMRRYATYDEAEAGHREVVSWLLAGLDDFLSDIQ